MEIRRHNWIFRCIVICLALVCWNGTAHDNGLEDDSALEIINLSSNLVVTDTEADAFLSCDAAFTSLYNSCFTIPARTPAKVGRQYSSKNTRHGGSLIKAGKSMSEYATSLYLKYITNFSLGPDESKPLFICLRKLIL